MSNVKERLIFFLDSKRISKAEFGRQIGVSNAFVTSIKNSISPEKLQKIKDSYPELNVEWLLTGEGAMLIGDVNGGNNAIGKESKVIVNESETISNLISVIKKEQEQKDRMLSIIEDLTSKMK